MTQTAEHISGGCLCGRIRYQASQDPFDAGYCHCRMCQKGLGGLFGAWVFFNHADFAFVGEEPTWFESSTNVKRGFCRICGSPLAFQPDKVDFITIWIGTLDEPATFRPRAHWNVERKIPWADIQCSLPVAQKGTVRAKSSAENGE